MSIKSQGGVFGRNPTFNDVTVEGDLSIAGTLSVGGETITGLSYQGGWNASTNTPDIAASSPVTGQFWIVSADGSTNVGGITNWTQGDWALYDGSNWQRVEGGNTDLSTGVQGQLAVANGGTGAADASTARTNLGLAIGTDVEAADATILKSADIGTSVQAYDADTAKYDDTTANFIGTLQNGGSNVLVDSDIGSTVQAYNANILTSSDIGSTVQAYDADTAKLDTAQTFTATQTFNNDIELANNSGINLSAGSVGLGNANSYIYIGTDDTGIMTNSGNDFIQPWNPSTGSSRDASIDLGRGTARWKNLFLSGGLYVGGTGAANLLDDYEEGTWTPEFVDSSGANNCAASNALNGAYYTKIGNQVTCSFRWNKSGGTAVAAYLDGLPFTPSSTSGKALNVSIAYGDATQGNANETKQYRFDSTARITLVGINLADLPAVMRAEFTYFTN